MKTEQGYGKTYNCIMHNPNISINARFLYGVLAGYADKNRECYPSRKNLLKITTMSERRFDKSMNELIEAGAVTIEKVRTGNKFPHNVYTLHERGG